MPRVGIEPTIPVFQRAKTVLTLDLAAAVIGHVQLHLRIISVAFSKSSLYSVLLHSQAIPLYSILFYFILFLFVFS
jgi:hypothetical protein